MNYDVCMLLKHADGVFSPHEPDMCVSHTARLVNLFLTLTKACDEGQKCRSAMWECQTQSFMKTSHLDTASVPKNWLFTNSESRGWIFFLWIPCIYNDSNIIIYVYSLYMYVYICVCVHTSLWSNWSGPDNAIFCVACIRRNDVRFNATLLSLTNDKLYSHTSWAF